VERAFRSLKTVDLHVRLGDDRQKQNSTHRSEYTLFDMLAQPTAIQQRAFDLLGLTLRLS
jgi:hypothetical protein